MSPALGERAGTLTGHARGEQPTRKAIEAVSLLGDIAAAVPIDEAKVWCETVAARLAEPRPGVHGGWDGEHVTVALKPASSPVAVLEQLLREF